MASNRQAGRSNGDVEMQAINPAGPAGRRRAYTTTAMTAKNHDLLMEGYNKKCHGVERCFMRITSSIAMIAFALFFTTLFMIFGRASKQTGVSQILWYGNLASFWAIIMMMAVSLFVILLLPRYRGVSGWRAMVLGEVRLDWMFEVKGKDGRGHIWTDYDEDENIEINQAFGSKGVTKYNFIGTNGHKYEIDFKTRMQTNLTDKRALPRRVRYVKSPYKVMDQNGNPVDLLEDEQKWTWTMRLKPIHWPLVIIFDANRVVGKFAQVFGIIIAAGSELDFSHAILAVGNFVLLDFDKLVEEDENGTSVASAATDKLSNVNNSVAEGIGSALDFTAGAASDFSNLSGIRQYELKFYAFLVVGFLTFVGVYCLWSNGCLRFKGKQLFKPTDKSSVIILKIMAFFVEFLSIPVLHHLVKTMDCSCPIPPLKPNSVTTNRTFMQLSGQWKKSIADTSIWIRNDGGGCGGYKWLDNAGVKGEWKWQTDFFKDSTQWDWEEIKENTNSTLDTADKALCFANFNDGGSGSGYVYHFVFLILAMVGICCFIFPASFFMLIADPKLAGNVLLDDRAEGINMISKRKREAPWEFMLTASIVMFAELVPKHYNEFKMMVLAALCLLLSLYFVNPFVFWGRCSPYSNKQDARTSLIRCGYPYNYEQANFVRCGLTMCLVALCGVQYAVLPDLCTWDENKRIVLGEDGKALCSSFYLGVNHATSRSGKTVQCLAENKKFPPTPSLTCGNSDGAVRLWRNVVVGIIAFSMILMMLRYRAWRQSNEEWNEDPRSSNQKRIADAAKSGKSVQVASSKSASGSKSAKSQRIGLAPTQSQGGGLARTTTPPRGHRGKTNERQVAPAGGATPRRPLNNGGSRRRQQPPDQGPEVVVRSVTRERQPLTIVISEPPPVGIALAQAFHEGEEILYIHHINPGTPASRYVDVGLQPRLVLVAVNKRSVQGQSYEQVAHEFTNAPRPLVLNFQGRIILDDEASSATDSLAGTGPPTVTVNIREPAGVSLGISVEQFGDQVVVAKVRPNTQAAAYIGQGLKRGMVLYAIAGEAVNNFSVEDFTRVVRDFPRPLRLTFRGMVKLPELAPQELAQAPPALAARFGVIRSDFSDPESTQYLAVSRGDQVQVLDDSSDKWWFVKNNEGNEGWVPKGYVKLVDAVMP